MIPDQNNQGEKFMKRFYITLEDKFGSMPKTLLVSKEELEIIKKYNPNLIIKVDFELIGKFSYEK